MDVTGEQAGAAGLGALLMVMLRVIYALVIDKRGMPTNGGRQEALLEQLRKDVDRATAILEKLDDRLDEHATRLTRIESERT